VINKRLLFALVFLTGLFTRESLGQDFSISEPEAEQIRSQAVLRIQELEGWMQYISQKGTTSEDVQDALMKIQEDGLFYDSLVSMEDDLFALRADSMFPKDVSVPQYLNDLHLFYNKSTDGKSIVFSDLRLSDIIRKDYAYLKVFFLARYRERHKDFSENYPVRKRVALMRIEKVKSDWKLRIGGISFLKEKNAEGVAISDADFEREFKPFVRERKNKLPTFMGASGDSLEFTQIQLKLKREFDSLYAENVKSKLIQSEAQKKRELLYQTSIREGDSLITAGNFAAAIEAFTDARTQKPFEVYPRDKVRELTRILQDPKSNPAEILKDQLNLAKEKLRLRDYEEALAEFQIARQLAPGDSFVQREIQRLDLMLRKRNMIRALYMDASPRVALKAFSAEATARKDDPDFFFERARCYLSSGDNRKALSDLSKAIALDPNFKQALVQRSEMYLQDKDYSQAIADLSALTVLEPANAEHCFNKAEAMKQNKDLDGAGKQYNQALKMDPENPRFLVARAALFRKVQKADEALKLLDKAISLRSAYPDAHFEKGMNLLDQNEEKEAAASLLKARRLGLSQAQTDFLDDLANAAEKQAGREEDSKNPEKALSLWQRSLIFRPNYPLTLLRIAEIQAGMGQNQEALTAVNKALFYKQDLVKGYLLKGRLLLASGDAKASLEPLYKARKFDSKNAQASLALGSAFASLPRLDSALVWFSDAIRIDSDLPEAYLQRGICHFHKESYTRALQDLESALNKNSKLSEACFYKGMVYKAYKRFDEAIDDFRQAISGGFNPYEASIQTGMCYEKLDKTSKARQYYTNAITYNQDLPAAYLLRGMNQLKDGNPKEAFADLDEGLKIDTSLSKTDYRVELGYLALQFEEPEKAEDNFRRVLDFDRFHPKGNFGLGLCLFNRGETVLAMQHLEQALISKKISMDEIKDMPGTKKLLKDKGFKELKSRFLR
jgi:tetratricopeptide (TPR) repeat protein